MIRWKRRSKVAPVVLALLLPPLAGLAADPPEGPAPGAPGPEAKEVIVYLGMSVADGVSISAELRPLVDRQLLKTLEMDRYQIVALAGAEPISMDDFTDQLAALASDAPPDPRPAWAADLERIQAAAYYAEIYLTSFDVSLDEVRAGQKAVVSMAAAIDLYQLDRSGPARPRARHVAQVGKVVPVQQVGMLREQGQLDAQLRPLVLRAAANLAGHLTLQLRRLPAFELQAKLIKAEGDRVFLPMGRNLGVALGDAFNIRERGADGHLRDVAFAKVSKLEADQAQAEVIATHGDWTFSGDEIAAKVDRSGIGLGAAAVIEYTGLDLFGNGGPGWYPGFVVSVTSDLSASVDWPEFHLAVDLDYLAVGSATAYQAGLVVDVHLGHATIGLHKRWHFGRLGLLAGLRAGIAYYIYSESGIVEEGATAHLGFGGDLVFGTDVFLAPWATLGVKLIGRYFSNPIDWVRVPYDEIGLRIEAGIQFTF